MRVLELDQFQTGLGRSVGAFLLASKTPPECCQAPFVAHEEPLGLEFLATRKDGEVAQSEVDAQLDLGSYLILALERDEVATAPVFGDDHRRDPGRLRQRPRPADSHGH